MVATAAVNDHCSLYIYYIISATTHSRIHQYDFTEKDYYTIFPDRNPKNNVSGKKSTTTTTEDNGDKIYEVGADGTVDISS